MELITVQWVLRAFLLVAAVGSSSDLVINGSFEQLDGDRWAVGWTRTVESPRYLSVGLGESEAVEGRRFIQFGPGSEWGGRGKDRMHQDLETEAGKTYQLLFHWEVRGGPERTQTLQFQVIADPEGDSSPLIDESLTEPATPKASISKETYTVVTRTFTATSDKTRLLFANQSESTDADILLDVVNVTEAPPAAESPAQP